MTDPFATKKKAPAPKKKVTVDGTELLRPQSIGKAVLEQVAAPIDWGEWLGFKKSEPNKSKQAHHMQPGVAYNPKQQEAQEQHEEKAEAPKQVETLINYSRDILHAGESKKEERESGQKVQMLIQELQRLAKSVQQIEKAMILQAIDPSAATKTGKYYESFFEWMLLVVQDARRKVEDSGAWLTAMKGKQKPGIHKVMKTNMQVGMSGERSQANNAG